MGRVAKRFSREGSRLACRTFRALCANVRFPPWRQSESSLERAPERSACPGSVSERTLPSVHGSLPFGECILVHSLISVFQLFNFLTGLAPFCPTFSYSTFLLALHLFVRVSVIQTFTKCVNEFVSYMRETGAVAVHTLVGLCARTHACLGKAKRKVERAPDLSHGKPRARQR